MKLNKTLAAGLAATLTAGALSAIAIAAPAQAYSGDSNLNCRLYFYDDGPGSSAVAVADTYALTQSPAQPAVGQTATLTFSAVHGPTTGPAQVKAHSQTVRATIDLSGAQTGTVQLVSATNSYPAAKVLAYSSMGGYSATGTYNVTSPGTVTAALKLLKFDDADDVAIGSGANVDTYCADMPDADIKAAGGAVSTTIKQDITQTPTYAAIATSDGQVDGAQYIARNSFIFGRNLTLTGTGFTASQAVGTGTVEFCDTTGTTCNTTPAVTNTLTTDAGQVLSGGITIPAGMTLTAGDRAIKISGLSAAPHLVPVHVLAKASITISPANGLRNTPVTVTGADYNVGKVATIYGSNTTDEMAASNNTTNPIVNVTASATGTFTSTFKVTDPTTAAVVAVQGYPIMGAPTAGQPSALKAFSVTPDVTKPTGTASVAPKLGALGLTSKVTVANLVDDAGAAYVTKSVTWGDGATTTIAAGALTGTHKYNKLGAWPVKVTLKDQTGNTSAAISAGTVVIKDTIKPIPTLTTPKAATKGSSWTTIKGKVTDAGGSGPKSVTVQLISKQGTKWFYFTGTKWVKTTSKAKALSKAKKITDTTIVSGAWSVKASKKPAKGTLYVTYSALDKAGNKSVVKTKSQSIKS